MFPPVCICIRGRRIPLRSSWEGLHQLASLDRRALRASVSLLKSREECQGRKHGYTGLRRAAQTLRKKISTIVFLPPNGFCYKYILLDMKGSLTTSASDLKCRNIFLESKSEVK